MNCFEELILKKTNQPFFLHFVKNLKFLCRARSTVWMDVLIMLICNTFLKKKKCPLNAVSQEKQDSK